MKRPRSVLLWLWLALALAACASQESARRNMVPLAVAQAACPTQPVVVCIAVTATPNAGSIVTPSPTVTASPTALATVTPWPTPTQIVQTTAWTPEPAPETGRYSPYYGQRVREGPGVNHAQAGWIGGQTVWPVVELFRYGNGDYWAHIRDSARGIDGWVAVIHTGLTYGVFTPN